MKISRTELQTYFKDPLPNIAGLADAFTFHAFEIDGIEGDILDVKVLPNRTADCSTAEGLARELAAILDIPLQRVRELSYEGQKAVEANVSRLNAILGASFTREEILNAFQRLGFKVEEEGETLRVTAPRPRTDIAIVEDLAEEVGQVLGYERIPALELPPVDTPANQDRFRGIERMKDMLIENGYIEVSTQSFAKTGDIELANPFDKTKPMLRTSLKEGLDEALVRAKQYAPLVLEPRVKPKLFEVGTVFSRVGEYLELHMTEVEPSFGHQKTSDNLSLANLEEFGKGYEPKKYTLGAYQAFSVYPFVLRDISFWASSGEGETPEDTTTEDPQFFERFIREYAGDLLARISLVDVFKKDSKVSYSFRLVFQSSDRTLTDTEVNERIELITGALEQAGHEIR